mmetsp:Transcript_42214/g.68391  ORF Transcript_42214/g.68391 Transcript_42214/m.68391 type:complete len:167 (+) Transcript_42214:119-619(+)
MSSRIMVRRRAALPAVAVLLAACYGCCVLEGSLRSEAFATPAFRTDLSAVAAKSLATPRSDLRRTAAAKDRDGDWATTKKAATDRDGKSSSDESADEAAAEPEKEREIDPIILAASLVAGVLGGGFVIAFFGIIFATIYLNVTGVPLFTIDGTVTGVPFASDTFGR